MTFTQRFRFKNAGVDVSGNPLEETEAAERQLIETAGFLYYEPGKVPQQGSLVVIGFAYWCGYDAKLLDILSRTRARWDDQYQVCVFAFDSHCTNDDEYKAYFRLGSYQELTGVPIVGWFRDGVAEKVESGPQARRNVYSRLVGEDWLDLARQPVERAQVIMQQVL